MDSHLRIHTGTCSWKYDSWIGLIYTSNASGNYLAEYSQHYSSVEVDQWFWSLFPGGKVKLPDPGVVDEYYESVPDDFKFSVKVPNSITLTHYYNRDKKTPLEENPYFLSPEVFDSFLEIMMRMGDKLGPLIFQFEYLNKQKMPGQDVFLEMLQEFFEAAPADFQYAVEIRNPNYLNEDFFNFLHRNDLSPVFLQGYFMPLITETYRTVKHTLKERTVIRLHGPNRQEIEKITGKRWGNIAAPKDDELRDIAGMILEIANSGIEIFLNVNNHYEGSAPLTIQKIEEMLRSES